jgi:hypothetical protein
MNYGVKIARGNAEYLRDKYERSGKAVDAELRGALPPPPLLRHLNEEQTRIARSCMALETGSASVEWTKLTSASSFVELAMKYTKPVSNEPRCVPPTARAKREQTRTGGSGALTTDANDRRSLVRQQSTLARRTNNRCSQARRASTSFSCARYACSACQQPPSLALASLPPPPPPNRVHIFFALASLAISVALGMAKATLDCSALQAFAFQFAACGREKMRTSREGGDRARLVVKEHTTHDFEWAVVKTMPIPLTNREFRNRYLGFKEPGGDLVLILEALPESTKVDYGANLIVVRAKTTGVIRFKPINGDTQCEGAWPQTNCRFANN